MTTANTTQAIGIYGHKLDQPFLTAHEGDLEYAVFMTGASQYRLIVTSLGQWPHAALYDKTHARLYLALDAMRQWLADEYEDYEAECEEAARRCRCCGC